MIDSMMNFGVSCGDLTSPQFIKNTEDKRPFTQNSLNSPQIPIPYYPHFLNLYFLYYYSIITYTAY